MHCLPCHRYPIASAAADKLGIGANIMSVAVMLGGSAGWVLPYSYQCNLMVYAAGKYKTKDFVKLGAPYHVSTDQVSVLAVRQACVAADCTLHCSSASCPGFSC